MLYWLFIGNHSAILEKKTVGVKDMEVPGVLKKQQVHFPGVKN